MTARREAMVVAFVAAGLALSSAGAKGALSVWTKVTEVTPDSVQRALVGQEVLLVATLARQGQHGAATEVLETWRALTNETGMVSFAGVKRHPRAKYRFQLPFQGVVYKSRDFDPGKGAPQKMRVFSVSPQPQDLSLRVVYSMFVDEVAVSVAVGVEVWNQSMLTIDYTHSPKGLRVPTLANMIGDRAYTHGLWPAGKVQGVEHVSGSAGRVVSEEGAVVFRGPVEPGKKVLFEIRYRVPFASEDIRLGGVSDVPIHNLSARVRWSKRIHPRVRLNVPYHASSRVGNDGIRSTELVVHGLLEPGQLFEVTFERLPVQTSVPAWLAGAGTAAGFAIFLLLVLAGVIRHRRTRA